MAVIFYKTFPEGSKPYLTLAGEEYVRPLSIGTAWTRLRVVLLLAIRSAASGVSNLTGCNFITGVCSGTANPYGGATTQHFFGCVQSADSNTALAQTLAYTANSGNPYYNATPNGYFSAFLRTGTTVSFLNYCGGSLAYAIADQGPVRKFMAGFEIIKGATVPTWNLRGFFPSSKPASAALNFTTTDLFTVLEDDGLAPTVQGQAFSWTALNNTVSINEAASGYFDTIDISWNKTQNPMEIYAIGVSRFA